MHTDQSVRIRWGSTQTNPFSVPNGAKQGGNISRVLFSIYADYILHGLKSNGMGCHVGAVFAGALAYADKIILLSPCRSVLNDMLDNAAMLSADFNLKFNPTKCQLLHFQPRPQRPLDGLSVAFCEQHVDLSILALCILAIILVTISVRRQCVGL